MPSRLTSMNMQQRHETRCGRIDGEHERLVLSGMQSLSENDADGIFCRVEGPCSRWDFMYAVCAAGCTALPRRHTQNPGMRPCSCTDLRDFACVPCFMSLADSVHKLASTNWRAKENGASQLPRRVVDARCEVMSDDS